MDAIRIKNQRINGSQIFDYYPGTAHNRELLIGLVELRCIAIVALYISVNWPRARQA